jgi:hypothetical protein
MLAQMMKVGLLLLLGCSALQADPIYLSWTGTTVLDFGTTTSSGSGLINGAALSFSVHLTYVNLGVTLSDWTWDWTQADLVSMSQTPDGIAFRLADVHPIGFGLALCSGACGFDVFDPGGYLYGGLAEFPDANAQFFEHDLAPEPREILLLALGALLITAFATMPRLAKCSGRRRSE